MYNVSTCIIQTSIRKILVNGECAPFRKAHQLELSSFLIRCCCTRTHATIIIPKNWRSHYESNCETREMADISHFSWIFDIQISLVSNNAQRTNNERVPKSKNVCNEQEVTMDPDNRSMHDSVVKSNEYT